MIVELGKPMAIFVNKWDETEKTSDARKELEKELSDLGQ